MSVPIHQRSYDCEAFDEGEGRLRVRGHLTDTKPLGLSIARGYWRKVKELFGGPNGCSHLGALLQALGPVAVQASWSLTNLHTDPRERIEVVDPEEQERRLRLNTNTCHVWAEGGAHLTAVALGNSMHRPRWEIERLRKLGVDLGDEQ